MGLTPAEVGILQLLRLSGDLSGCSRTSAGNSLVSMSIDNIEHSRSSRPLHLPSSSSLEVDIQEIIGSGEEQRALVSVSPPPCP